LKRGKLSPRSSIFGSLANTNEYSIGSLYKRPQRLASLDTTTPDRQRPVMRQALAGIGNWIHKAKTTCLHRRLFASRSQALSSNVRAARVKGKREKCAVHRCGTRLAQSGKERQLFQGDLGSGWQNFNGRCKANNQATMC